MNWKKMLSKRDMSGNNKLVCCGGVLCPGSKVHAERVRQFIETVVLPEELKEYQEYIKYIDDYKRSNY